MSNVIEQASEEFDQLVNHLIHGDEIDNESIRSAIGLDLHMLLDAVASIKAVYITQRVVALNKDDNQIGADSFIPTQQSENG